MKELLLPNSGAELLKVHPSDILYIEADGNYCNMHLTGGFCQQLWFSRQKFIGMISEQLRTERPAFITVGRSYIKGELILFDRNRPSLMTLHASQEALNSLKRIISMDDSDIIQDRLNR